MFIQQGKKYLLVSNIDNLGGTLDVKILNFIQQQSCPFLIEAVLKNQQDTKGGCLLFNKSKNQTFRKYRIRNDAFQHTKFKRTPHKSNLWINLLALQRIKKKILATGSSQKLEKNWLSKKNS